MTLDKGTDKFGFIGIALMGVIAMITFDATSNQVLGQEIEISSDIKRMAEFYDSLQSFTVSINMEFYTESNDPRPTRVERASIAKHGRNFIFKLRELEMLLSEGYLITCNHSLKLITVAEDKPEWYSINHVMDPMLMDSMLSMAASIALIESTTSLRVYRFLYHEGLFNRIDISIDITDYSLKWVDYQYSDKSDQGFQRIHINYSSFSAIVHDQTVSFELNHYIKFIAGSLLPSDSFKGYSIAFIKEDEPPIFIGK